MITIDCNRITLRDHQPNDLAAFHAWRSNPNVMKYVGFSRSSSIDESATRLAEAIAEISNPNRSMYFFAIVLKESGALIGDCGITVEKREITGGIGQIGYFLLEDFWGKGLATEAARALITFGFKNLLMHKLIAKCDSDNTASEAVMMKCKMKREAYFRSQRYRDGRWVDEYQYYLLAKGTR